MLCKAARRILFHAAATSTTSVGQLDLRLSRCAHITDGTESLWIRSWWEPAGNGRDRVVAKDVTGAGEVVSQGSAGARLNMLVEQGMLKEALHDVDLLAHHEVRLSSHLLCRLLQLALNRKDLAAGRKVQLLITNYGLDSNAVLVNLLIQLFSACGDLEQATAAFYKLQSPTVEAWRAIIMVHVRQCQWQKAIRLYAEMREAGVQPEEHVYVAILKSCSMAVAVRQGREVHAHIMASGHEQNLFVATALIAMYVKFRSIDDASNVYSQLRKRDLVSCNFLMAGYADNGCGLEALKVFGEMLRMGVKPDNATFVSAFKACGLVGALDQAKLIHASSIQLGLSLNAAAVSSLTEMYIKCGSLEDARLAFDEAHRRDLKCWNVLLAGYVQGGHPQEALVLFHKLCEDGLRLNRTTFFTALRACSSLRDLDQGKLTHAWVVKAGLDADPMLMSALEEMYHSCGFAGK